MSYPDNEAEVTPGWRYLATWVPGWMDDKYRFWQGIGSIMFVLATNFSPVLQRPFNTAFVQYFGKISYAIYLMHGPVLHTVGYSIMRWAWSITGSTTEGQYVFGFILAALIITPVTVWAADVFCRFVDEPIVRFAKWVETQCISHE
jgi:peptidoglycan/LPS O-acetylase OafA/YrhL